MIQFIATFKRTLITNNHLKAWHYLKLVSQDDVADILRGEPDPVIALGFGPGAIHLHIHVYSIPCIIILEPLNSKA